MYEEAYGMSKKKRKHRIRSLFDEDINDIIDIFDIGDSETALFLMYQEAYERSKKRKTDYIA